MINILTVDLEEYFCAKNLGSFAPRAAWDSFALRAENPTKRLLDLFDEFRCEATFFVLGWVAERLPELVREIGRRGHEVATHGHEHRSLAKMDPRSFEDDLQRALAATQPLVNQKICGFRAPSFTITPATTWAYDIMERCGIRYDSSVFPVAFYLDYGFPGAPLNAYAVMKNLTEVPMSCIEIAGRRVSCTGGGYFRMLPYAWTRFLFRRCNAEGRPFVFYLYPWELDPGQPRYPLPYFKHWRHYTNLAKTEKRLRRLLGDFSFTSNRKALPL